MTVYVIQEPRPFKDRGTGRTITRDISSAADYGAIIYLLTRHDEPSNLPGPCLNKLRSGLQDFDPEEDYILFPGGDPVGMILAGAILRDLPIRGFNFLRWDRIRDGEGKHTGHGAYTPVRVQL